MLQPSGISHSKFPKIPPNCQQDLDTSKPVILLFRYSHYELIHTTNTERLAIAVVSAVAIARSCEQDLWPKRGNFRW